MSILLVISPYDNTKASALTANATGPYSWTDQSGFTHTTAYIEINDQIVFCINPEKPAPYGGHTYNENRLYDESIKAILYFGYGGAGNEIGNTKTDYVKTWVAINNWLEGKTDKKTSSNNDPEVWKLIQHAKNKDVPDTTKISFSKTSVSTSVSGNVQKSGTIKLNASSKNNVTINLPSKVTIHVGTKTKTGGSYTVNGGESFYFTAPLDYGTVFTTGQLKGEVYTYAGLLYLPTSDNYQSLNGGKFVIDPAKTSGFTVNFEKKQRKITILHKDKYNGKTLLTETENKTIGTDYSYSPKSSITFNGDTYSPVSTTKQSGTVGNTNITITFYYDLQREITVLHKDKYDDTILKTEKTTKKRGDTYKYSPNSEIKIGGNIYIPISTTEKSGTVGAKNITITFYYNLQRNITILHKDNRDGSLLKEVKETSLRGKKYSYSPLTNLKKGSYTYRPISNKIQSGTVQDKDITITFYYDVPLIKVGLKKIQIYTAPAKEKLPVKISLTKSYVYPSTNPDMETAQIKINLYKNTTKVASASYTAKTLPNNIDLSIPAKYLTKDTHYPYTVKLEGYKVTDVDVSKSDSSLTTDGYTSSENTIEVNSSSQSKVEYKGVVMTEHEINKDMKVYYETFNIPVKPINKMRTGYGFSQLLNITYINDIGNDTLDTVVKMNVPESIVDKNYLSYPVKNNIATITLDKTEDKNSSSDNKVTFVQTFELPHVNVEDQTGYLFTDKQVNNKDKKIKHNLLDGSRKFYLPIWGDLGNYKINVYSNKTIGINKVNFQIQHNLNVFAFMYASMDSKTITKDAILMVPVNKDDPFPNGRPDDWTQKDLNWLKNDNW